MFTGIIETRGEILQIRESGTNKDFCFRSSLLNELQVDQSISHNGVCLTVTAIESDCYWVTAIDETLKKTNLGQLRVGDHVNIERCLRSDGRFDGHIVQGHIDQVGTCTNISDENGSWLFDFQYDPSLGNVTVEKGSIAINGVSLTCFRSHENGFTVAIIPYTFLHTNFQTLRVGDQVNLEFDIVGKYVKRLLGK